MKYPVIDGYVYPVSVMFEAQGAEFAELSADEAKFVDDEWNADEPKAYKADGSGSTDADAAFKKVVNDAFNSGPLGKELANRAKKRENAENAARNAAKAKFDGKGR